ncbi:reverse transcriptase domain-containing protein [Tanacetum coccineum]
MADNRTMAQMLQAPIEGYEDAIVVPPINANNFELKQPLINLVQSNKFTGRQDPHNHLRFFNKVTSTFRHPEVPNTSIKLLLFPFSLDGEARDWLDKEPPRSILTWDDLVSKFINQFFPPSKTTYYRNEIITFYQKPNETFNEAWERFKGLLRQCPHHGFSELHQLDTFYNSLNSNDQDALDSAAGGNFLTRLPQEVEVYYQKLKGYWDEIDALEAPYICMISERILKSKRAKTSQNRQETEETSDQVQEKDLKPFSKAGKESRNIQLKPKKVNEDPIEVKGSIMTSFQSSRAHLDVLKLLIGPNTSPYIINGLNSNEKDPTAGNDGSSNLLLSSSSPINKRLDSS